jgi:hypothetical protein
MSNRRNTWLIVPQRSSGKKEQNTSGGGVIIAPLLMLITIPMAIFIGGAYMIPVIIGLIIFSILIGVLLI